jgi:hypothetical protein
MSVETSSSPSGRVGRRFTAPEFSAAMVMAVEGGPGGDWQPVGGCGAAAENFGAAPEQWKLSFSE